MAKRSEPPLRAGEPPPEGEDWIALAEDRLPVEEVLAWLVRPDCGGLVVFCGTVRDHSEGRHGVVELEYEAYLEQVEPRLRAIVDQARARWPEAGRLALLHRVGRLALGEVSVVTAASAPHRAQAFELARFCIDTVKTSVPIWKRETWAGGTDWATCSHEVLEVGVPEPEASGRP